MNQPVVNIITCIILGWVLWNLLAIPYATIIVPMVVNNQLPFVVLHIYFGMSFFLVGVFIGLASNANIWFPLVGTFSAIIITMAIISKMEELVTLIVNLMAFVGMVFLVVGGYIGKLIKKVLPELS
jgi:hypothetical protein